MKTQPRTLRLMASAAVWAGLLSASLTLTGCTVLPESTTKTKTPWADYAAAQAAFDKVQPSKTSRADLHALGFSPDVLPNTRILNYVDVVNLFGASFRLADLPKGIQVCVDARDNCQAYVIRAQNLQNKREGNVPADLFGFRKQIRTTGWEFLATLVMVNDVVTYKLWNGTPTVESTTNEKNPLGPMQSMGGLIPKPF